MHLGVSEATVQREVARARAIPNVLRIAGTSLDKPEYPRRLANPQAKWRVPEWLPMGRVTATLWCWWRRENVAAKCSSRGEKGEAGGRIFRR